jgi:hypothetical protein
VLASASDLRGYEGAANDAGDSDEGLIDDSQASAGEKEEPDPVVQPGGQKGNAGLLEMLTLRWHPKRQLTQQEVRRREPRPPRARRLSCYLMYRALGEPGKSEKCPFKVCTTYRTLIGTACALDGMIRQL